MILLMLTMLLGACCSFVFYGSMMMLATVVRVIQFILIMWSHVGVSTFVGGAGDYIRR